MGNDSQKTRKPDNFLLHFICLVDTKSSFSLSFSPEESKTLSISMLKSRLEEYSEKLGFFPSNIHTFYDISIDNINEKKPLTYIKLAAPLFFDVYYKVFIKVRDTSFSVTFNRLKISTLLQLKAEIASTSGIILEELHLEFEGKMLQEDLKPLEYYGIKHLSTLIQHKICITFVSKHNPSHYEAYYSLDENVGHLMMRLGKTLGISDQDIFLTYNDTVLEAHHQLSDYFFQAKNSVVICLMYPETINILFFNRIFECSPNITVKDLFQLMVSNNVIFPEKNFVLAEKSKGIRLNLINETLASYLLPHNPEIIVVETYQITVSHGEEAYFNLDVDEHFQLRQLKHYYSLISGVDCKDKTVTLNGDHYGNDLDCKTMKELNISEGNLIRILMTTVEKEPVMDERMSLRRRFSKVKQDKNTPVWRIVRSGLSLEGTCLNRSCTAYKEKVFCNPYSEIFDMKDTEAIICPVCKKTIVPESIGFTNCKYSYAYVKEIKETQFEMVQKQRWTYVGKTFKYFQEPLSDNNKWIDMKIFIKLTEGDESEKIEEFCGLCRNNLQNLKFRKLLCGHVFHNQCEVMMRDITMLKCYLCNK